MGEKVSHPCETIAKIVVLYILLHVYMIGGKTTQFRIFVSLFAVYKHEDCSIQNHDFVCCFVWVWNFVCHMKPRILADSVQEWGYCGGHFDLIGRE
jgi:hypothetical protein